MLGWGARKIELSEVQPQILEQLVRQRQREHGLVNRAPIILGAAAGHRNAEIGGKLNQQRLSVRRWRQRWSAASETVAAVGRGHEERAGPVWRHLKRGGPCLAQRANRHPQGGAKGGRGGGKGRKPHHQGASPTNPE